MIDILEAINLITESGATISFRKLGGIRINFSNPPVVISRDDITEADFNSALKCFLHEAKIINNKNLFDSECKFANAETRIQDLEKELESIKNLKETRQQDVNKYEGIANKFNELEKKLICKK